MFDIVSGALRVSLVTFVLCGFAYPFAVTVASCSHRFRRMAVSRQAQTAWFLALD